MSEDKDLVLETRKTALYRFVRGLLGSLSWILFRPGVTGAERIPTDGPVILAPVHRSNIDFVFTIFLSPRKVFFMAKDGLYRSRLFGWILTRVGAFPVNRSGADRESMRLAEEVLRRGEALVLFPEGTRQSGEAIGTLHDGTMFIASREGARVVPIGIAGTDRALPKGAKFLHPTRVRVVVGEPIDPPVSEGRVSRSAVTAKTEELRGALQAAYDEARRQLD